MGEAAIDGGWIEIEEVNAFLTERLAPSTSNGRHLLMVVARGIVRSPGAHRWGAALIGG
jgi:hypothetical protein